MQDDVRKGTIRIFAEVSGIARFTDMNEGNAKFVGQIKHHGPALLLFRCCPMAYRSITYEIMFSAAIRSARLGSTLHLDQGWPAGAALVSLDNAKTGGMKHAQEQSHETWIEYSRPNDRLDLIHGIRSAERSSSILQSLVHRFGFI